MPIVFMIIIVISVLLVYIYPYIIKEKWFQKSMIILIPGASYLLYLFKIKWQIFYGFTETVVGIITILFSFFSESVNALDILKVLGGFYIIIRGLDNIDKGIISPVIKKRWRKLFFAKTE